MGQPIMGVLVTNVAPEREAEFLAGMREILATGKPDGFLRYEVLRGREGQWLIHSLWRDREAMATLRVAGRVPPVLVLLDSLGATHSHDLFTVELTA